MSEFRQPWRRVAIAGHRCRMQVLDPSTAFRLEPEIAAQLGDAASMLMAAPDAVMAAVAKSVRAGTTRVSIGLGPVDEFEPDPTLDAITRWGQVIARALAGLDVDGRWLASTWRACVLERLEVDGRVIEDAEDWQRLGWGWAAKWHALAAQMRNTFAPLWTRSPYLLRTEVETHGVPEPTSVPLAVRWADALAVQGHAASSREILREWTPLEVIEIVESAAYQAERERRAHKAAMAGKGKGKGR